MFVFKKKSQLYIDSAEIENVYSLKRISLKLKVYVKSAIAEVHSLTKDAVTSTTIKKFKYFLRTEK